MQHKDTEKIKWPDFFTVTAHSWCPTIEHIIHLHPGKTKPIILQQCSDYDAPITITSMSRACRLRYGLQLCIWWWSSESSVYYKQIKWLSQLTFNSDLLALSVLFAHLSTRNHPKALYLPWQKIGLGCGSRWKQACVATKDIVITNTFEDPEVSNVSPSKAGRTTPTFSPLSVQSLKQPPQTQRNEWLGRGRSVFLTTTPYLSRMSPPDSSACTS